jgi:hypothetical protein
MITTDMTLHSRTLPFQALSAVVPEMIRHFDRVSGGLCFLVALKIRYPLSIWAVRANHETRSMSGFGGRGRREARLVHVGAVLRRL